MNNYRLYLRAFEPNDYLTTHAWRKDEEMWSTVTGRKYFVSSEYEKKWINDAIFENKNNLRLALCLKDTSQHIGIVSLMDIDWFSRNANIGLLIGNKENRGKGYGYEASILILYHGFIDLGLERIYAVPMTSNKGSIEICQKIFKKEGILRHSVYKNGKYEDQVIFSILKEEFMALIN